MHKFHLMVGLKESPAKKEGSLPESVELLPGLILPLQADVQVPAVHFFRKPVFTLGTCQNMPCQKARCGFRVK